jgi:heme ABC exporter ATP-binding subunit CcmA
VSYIRKAPISALCAEGLGARYPGQAASRPALEDVTLRLAPGERVLLLGPNGAGKSTLLRVFAGLMRATTGEATIHGLPIRQARRHVGVVGHTTYLYDELTARENLRFYGDLYGVDRLERRIAEMLERVGLDGRGDVQVGQMSRGQQQRVAIARALLHDPRVLLLDEPETGLDVSAFSLLEQLACESHRTVLLASHNVSAGLRIGSRVVVLDSGRIAYQQASASPDDGSAISARLHSLARSVAEAA